MIITFYKMKIMKTLPLSLCLCLSLGLSSCGDEKQNNNHAGLQDPAEGQEQRNGPVFSDSIPITDNTSYSHEVVVPGLQIGWGMAFLPDGSMLITEKSGELIHFRNGQKSQVQGVPEVYNRGQGGLLDVAVDPDFESNNLIYLTYASSEGEGEGGNTALTKAKLENGQLVDKQVLYKGAENSTAGQHFGSRIVFDNDGDIFFTIGDRGNEHNNPQDLTRDGGKVYRLKDDGSIPDDNPFTSEEGAVGAIYSYGHRNPQGMIKHPETGEMWLHEHGPLGGDEINIVKRAANYGWPEVTYGIDYDGSTISDETAGPDYEAPIFVWIPSIAPSGMVYVTSDKYPELQGNLLAGSLKFQYVEHLVLDGERVVKREKLLKDIGRIRDIEQGPDGFIYVSVEGVGIVKLIPGE